MSESSKPVKKFRAGHLELAVWANQIEIQETQITSYSVTMKKSIKVNDEWKETNSLFTQELPIAMMLMYKAYDWIYFAEKSVNN